MAEKKIKKIINLVVTFLVFTFFVSLADARPFENPIASAIKKAEISSSALISASFVDISNGRKIYQMNSNIPMTPASVQKIVTMLPSFNTLGYDYEFQTQLYKGGNGNLYIKLGADPYLTTKDLKYLIKSLERYKVSSTNAFYIDDSILDSNEWGDGWQWDDDMNPLIPKFGSYNLDKNTMVINVNPTQPGAPADIFTDVFYPTAFMNNVITGNKTEIQLQRKNYISPDVIDATGVVSADTQIEIPVNYPRRYFILRLEDILRKQKISYYGDFNRLKLPTKNVYLICETKHPLSQAADDILKKSNNMMAETVFKLAGGKYAQETGSVSAAVEMLNDYYAKQGLCTDKIKIVDGSGVSKDNLMTADFVTQVLYKESKNDSFDNFKMHLATPGVGTLSDRMLYFKDNLMAKTGTLKNISSIAGYIKTRSGKTYAFCIMTKDSKSKSADKKAFEEYVLRKAFDEL